MSHLETIRTGIEAMRAETLGENRPDVNRKLLDDMIAAYNGIDHIDFSDTNRDSIIRMLHAVWAVKHFVQTDQPELAQTFLPGLLRLHATK
jgi:hypothetical protein